MEIALACHSFSIRCIIHSEWNSKESMIINQIHDLKNKFKFKLQLLVAKLQ